MIGSRCALTQAQVLAGPARNRITATRIFNVPVLIEADIRVETIPALHDLGNSLAGTDAERLTDAFAQHGAGSGRGRLAAAADGRQALTRFTAWN